MAKSQTIARLGVQMALDSAEFKSGASNVIVETQKLRNSVAREMRAAEKEIQTLKYATEDYGKTVTKVAQLERELESGRFKNLKSTEGGQAVIARLREQAKAYDEVAAKAKTAATGGLTEQQKLQLTYQTTDLVTQIASGQNALIALLQQGGQLKDSMGGFQGMFRALASVITPFRVAVAGAASAVGLLALAFYKGSEESQRLRDDMILTGNYAGMTQRKFFELSETIANKLNVTVGDSKTVFGQLVASGKFTQQSIGSVGEAILRIADLSGKSADEIAKDLIPAFDGSASSVKNLNDKMHFLTLEQYRNIEALEKQGRTQEAAQLAADALNDKLSTQERRLGSLERMWKAITTTASAAWDALLGLGRAESPEERIEKLTKQINKMAMTLQGANPDSIYTDKLRDSMIAKMKELGEEMRKQQEKQEEEQANRKQTDLINRYAAAGGLQKQLALEDEFLKLSTQNKYQNAMFNAGMTQKIYLEAEEKTELARQEMARKNRDQNNVFEKQNAAILAQQIIEIERDKRLKLREMALRETLSIQAMIEELDEAMATEIGRKNEVFNSLIRANQANKEGLEIDQRKLELQRNLIGATAQEAALENIRLKYEEQRRALRNNRDVDDERKGQLERQIDQAEQIERANAAIQDSIIRIGQVYDAVFGNMMNAIERFVRTGKMSFRDLARSIIQDLIMIQIRAQATALFSMLMGNIGAAFRYGTNIGSQQTSMLAAQDAFFKADGGPVVGNQPYIVGERGPELFVPRGAGTIIPNHAMGAASTTNVTNNYINAIDVKSFEDRLLGSANTIWAANLYAQKRLPLGTGRM
jgi:phage-related minor tail protein